MEPRQILNYEKVPDDKNKVSQKHFCAAVKELLLIIFHITSIINLDQISTSLYSFSLYKSDNI